MYTLGFLHEKKSPAALKQQKALLFGYILQQKRRLSSALQDVRPVAPSLFVSMVYYRAVIYKLLERLMQSDRCESRHRSRDDRHQVDRMIRDAAENRSEDRKHERDPFIIRRHEVLHKVADDQGRD